jgi:hypothetical protein
MSGDINNMPAFPCETLNDTCERLVDGFGTEVPGNSTANYYGMSMRDYFAAKALAALIGRQDKDSHNRGKKAVPLLALYAYEYADAMLKERLS